MKNRWIACLLAAGMIGGMWSAPAAGAAETGSGRETAWEQPTAENLPDATEAETEEPAAESTQDAPETETKEPEAESTQGAPEAEAEETASESTRTSRETGMEETGGSGEISPRVQAARAAWEFLTETEKGLQEIKTARSGGLVVLTVPVSLGGQQTQEALDSAIAGGDCVTAVLNADGSASYVMTGEQHEAYMETIRAEAREELSDIAESEDYPRIVSIESNDSFTTFQIHVATSEIGFSERMALVELFMTADKYHSFNGDEPERFVVHFVDESTGEEFWKIDSSYATEY